MNWRATRRGILETLFWVLLFAGTAVWLARTDRLPPIVEEEYREWIVAKTDFLFSATGLARLSAGTGDAVDVLVNDPGRRDARFRNRALAGAVRDYARLHAGVVESVSESPFVQYAFATSRFGENDYAAREYLARFLEGMPGPRRFQILDSSGNAVLEVPGGGVKAVFPPELRAALELARKSFEVVVWSDGNSLVFLRGLGGPGRKEDVATAVVAEWVPAEELRNVVFSREGYSTFVVDRRGVVAGSSASEPLLGAGFSGASVVDVAAHGRARVADTGATLYVTPGPFDWAVATAAPRFGFLPILLAVVKVVAFVGFVVFGFVALGRAAGEWKRLGGARASHREKRATLAQRITRFNEELRTVIVGGGARVAALVDTIHRRIDSSPIRGSAQLVRKVLSLARRGPVPSACVPWATSVEGLREAPGAATISSDGGWVLAQALGRPGLSPVSLEDRSGYVPGMESGAEQLTLVPDEGLELTVPGLDIAGMGLPKTPERPRVVEPAAAASEGIFEVPDAKPAGFEEAVPEAEAVAAGGDETLAAGDVAHAAPAPAARVAPVERPTPRHAEPEIRREVALSPAVVPTPPAAIPEFVPFGARRPKVVDFAAARRARILAGRPVFRDYLVTDPAAPGGFSVLAPSQEG